MLNYQQIKIIALLAALPMFVFSGCESGGTSGPAEADLSSTIDSVSYSIGHLYGSQLRQQGMSDIKSEKFITGFRQGLEDKEPQLEQAKVQQLLQAYQIKAQQNAQKMKSEEADINRKEGEAFLEENISKEGVNMTESGMQYKVLEEGSGASPAESDSVTVHYEGTLTDGTVFDSSYERGQPVTFPLNGVIQGWTEGVQLMKEGATYKFWIPAELAYGENPPARSPIDPGELLIFKVELIEIK